MKNKNRNESQGAHEWQATNFSVRIQTPNSAQNKQKKFIKRNDSKENFKFD